MIGNRLVTARTRGGAKAALFAKLGLVPMVGQEPTRVAAE